MLKERIDSTTPQVAPCAGAWIEIHVLESVDLGTESLPVRERGLK